MKKNDLRISLTGMLALLLTASCVTENAPVEDFLVAGPDIRAAQEGDKATRTTLTTDAEGAGTIYWLPGERINVFFNRQGALYTSTNESNATKTVFHTEDVVDYSSIQEKNIWGLYPYDSEAECDGTSVTTTVPASQKAVPGTFDTDLFPLLAHSTSTDLVFYNVCGGIKFSLTRDDIYKITFRGNADEGLAGKVKLSMSSEGRPTAQVVGAEKTLVLTPLEGTTFKKDKDYYLVCLPAALSQGFEMTFYSVTGKKASYKRSDAVTVKRAVFTRKAHIDENATVWEDNPEMTGGKRSGLYLGITGFNQEIYNYPITRLNDVSISSFNSFVNGLPMKNGTLLCYGVDQSISRFQEAVFPDDLCAVALVTFTDGLDQGSVMMNPAFSSDEQYLDAIQDRILHEKVAGHPIMAYSVGLKGSDVSDVNKFRSNLQKLASPGNAFEVNSMSEVNSRLQQIATNVTDISYLYDIALRIPGQSDGTRVRFTFDSVSDASYSSVYIEGIFRLSDYSLREVTYHGLSTESGSVIPGTAEGIFVTYSFGKVRRLDESAINPSSIKQWNYITSTGKWQVNSEFDASQNVDVEVTKRSVAVMLVLDCSSSLGSQFSTMQSHARSFIRALQQASYDPYAVSSVSLNTTSLSLTVQNMTQLVARVTPDTARDKSVTWTSSDPSVATVDQEGKVYALTPGTAVIVVTTTDGGYTASCTVQVKPVYVTQITLDKQNISLQKGKTTQIQATFLPEGATIKAANWTSDNEAVATVDQTGLVTAVGPGETTIRATASDGGGRTASCAVTCWDAPELVDLGLSVKWGSLNIGASAPEKYGDYFAWGETETKTSFSWSNYKWSNNGSSSNFTKYNVNSSYGTVDGKKILEAQDDAAAVILGGTWRMPTKEEYDELLNTENCTWTWTSQNGVQGYKVTSRKEGFTDKSIFFPVSGYKNGTSRNNTSYDYIWTSSLYTDGSNSAWRLYATSSSRSTGAMNRYYGLPVRPVSNVPVTAIAFDPAQVTLKAGETATLTPVFSPRQPASYQLNWSSSNENVVKVASDGTVHARKAGTATVTAALPNSSLKASCTVKVEAWGETEVVDLGLSVKWATVNLGATSPEEYGNYYAWGETDPKTSYNWGTYRWSADGTSSNLTKYNTSDGKTILESQDDPAALMGGTWRMPTQAEFNELNNTSNCSWSWTTQNGVRGYKVTSRKTGFTDKFIFLPAAGYRDGTNLNSTASYGYYWTSSLNGSSLNSAYRLQGSSSSHSMSSSNRSLGYTVRPVMAFSGTAMAFDPVEMFLNVGSSTTLNPVFTPRAPLSYTLKWTSSDEKVATVSSSGVVKAVSQGKATITATLEGTSFTASCTVTVIQMVTGITLSPSSLSLRKGSSQNLTATLTPADATIKTLTWSSDDETVATVSQAGLVTAVGPGETTIRATASDGGGRTASCAITCWDAPELVDLGLSVKWGSLNIGASAPEKYGDYFAWGETETKTSFSWSNYKWSNNGSSSNFTKYNVNSSYGTVDGKKILEAQDDAAAVLLGGSWRMPTKEEYDELLNTENCTWTWTTQNGVQGYKVTSRKTGYTDKSIFLPVSGYKNGASRSNTSYDYIWTSSLYTDGPNSAWRLYATSSSHSTGAMNRYYGLPVRPVSNVPVTAITLQPSQLSLKLGESTTLKPVFSPRQPLSYSLNWSSSNENVATVSPEGVVRARKAGSAMITASLPNSTLKATCTVKVEAWGETEVVDLGLSVQWATVNIGASEPEGYGDYFAWGETEPKLNYNWATYRWSADGSSSNVTKYNASDGKTILESQDDAATALLGGTWRMPTREEVEELNNSGNCSWSWTTQNGIRGYKVTSRKTGFTDKSIFLPAAGYQDGTYLSNAASYGYFWSSSLYGNNSAYAFYHHSSGHYNSTINRYQGCSVRPVKEITLTKFVLDTPEATLNVGASRTLTLTAEPRTPAAVVWTSSRPEVATVSAGTVKAIAPGKTTITVATPSGANKATCVVTVIQPVSSVVLNKTSILVKEGGKETLTATVSPENATDKSLTWTSTNEAIVKVDKNGTVTGVAKGKAAVWASANDGSGVHAECTVWVCRDEPVATPELVDLGLSVKWASFNLGAIAPEGYGDYYAWGEIYGYSEGKETFDWSSYIWSQGSSSTVFKYNATDNKAVLDMEDDVARVKLGGSWRIPTQAETDELRENCTWSWTTQNGVRGYKVTSRKEGFTDKSIFLPAGGYRSGTSLSNASSAGYFWTTTLNPNDPRSAWRLYLGSSSRYNSTTDRYYGSSIRPVVGIPLTSIALSSEAVVNMGSTITLTPTYTPRQPAAVRWTSSDTGVASVDAKGVVRGVNLGTATITVSTVDGAKKASCKVTVVQPVTSVAMVYSQAGVPVGTTRRLAVKIGPENAYNKEVIWTSSNTAVATVDADGTVTGVSKGTATIRATAKDGSGRNASCNLTVYNNVATTSPEAVDLGLSVKWASFNLGASTPEGYGDFYGWGEIFGYNDGKTNFNWSTYQWSNGNSYSLTRYNTNTNNGTVDDKTVLETGDDAARFKLGGKWRIPTEAEFAELRNLNNCSWTWTTRNEKTGYLVTSKKNGNSIFLPVGGYRSSSSIYNTAIGYYWTSTLVSGSPIQAYSVDLSASGLEPKTHDRQQGQAIRAVTP